MELKQIENSKGGPAIHQLCMLPSAVLTSFNDLYLWTLKNETSLHLVLYVICFEGLATNQLGFAPQKTSMCGPIG
jgi:hypothetical protein